jgi:hypothetical protein
MKVVPYEKRKRLLLQTLFKVLFNLVTPAGFEPAIFWMRTKYPGPLDEGAIQFFTSHKSTRK